MAPVFFAFRLMVGVGVLMLLLAWLGAWSAAQRAPPRWLLWTFAGFTFSGWVATLAGWLVTEIGRQPWLVTGILRTADAVGAAREAQLGASLTAYVLDVRAMLLAYMVVLTHLASEGAKAMSLDLPLVFAVLMGVAILAYVVLDGYDLGVGMLMPAATSAEQDVMVASIGPFWDANETWLVLGVGILLVAFPLAHGYILGALYLPVAAMLIGLMLRGVAFELRVKAEGWHAELWNWLFWFGSFLASFAQGLHARALPHRRSMPGWRTGSSRCWSARPLRRLRAARRDLARAAHRGRAAEEGGGAGHAGASRGWRSAWRW